jgi:hypothetical protein
MTRKILTAILLLAVIIPAVAQTQPAQTQPDEQSMRILDKLEQAGEKHPTIEADVLHDVFMRLSGDREVRQGRVAYQRQTPENPSRFYIRFDTLQQGAGRRLEDKVEYAFDGGMWLTEIKHRLKKVTRYQVARQGQQIEPLRLGKGPFPLPFGQKSEDMLEHFDVSTRPSAPGDPADTDFLKLLTKPQHKDDINFVWMEMWVDRASGLPTKIRCEETASKNIVTVTFSNTRTGAAVDTGLFSITPPRGWQIEVVPLDK